MCVCVVSKQEAHEIIHCKVVSPSFLFVSFGVGLTGFASFPYLLHTHPLLITQLVLTFLKIFFFSSGTSQIE